MQEITSTISQINHGGVSNQLVCGEILSIMCDGPCKFMSIVGEGKDGMKNLVDGVNSCSLKLFCLDDAIKKFILYDKFDNR